MFPAHFSGAGARVALALLLYACASTGGAAAARPKAATRTVVIEAVQFSPGTLHAKVGDTVVWVNKDPFPHTATSPGHFDSGPIDSGRSWRFKPKAKGTFPYICTLHPTMKALLVVE